MLVAFDLDGTLVDSARDLADSTNDVLVSHGAEPLPLDAVTAMIGEGARVLISKARAARGVDAPVADLLAAFMQAYAVRLTRHTRPYPGVHEAVATIGAQARLAVVTNKPLEPARRLLEAFGLAEAFDWVIGGDGAFPRKPDPASLRHVMVAAGVTPAATIFVGDSPIDVATARAAGVTLCVARYGFGWREATELRPADLIVDDPRALGATIIGAIDERTAR